MIRKEREFFQRAFLKILGFATLSSHFVAHFIEFPAIFDKVSDKVHGIDGNRRYDPSSQPPSDLLRSAAMRHSGKAFRAGLRIIFWTLVLLFAIFAIGIMATLLGAIIATVSTILVLVWILFAVF